MGGHRLLVLVCMCLIVIGPPDTVLHHVFETLSVANEPPETSDKFNKRPQNHMGIERSANRVRLFH